MRARNTVVFTNRSRPLPAASRMARRLAKICSVCSPAVAPVSVVSPGLRAIWPETKTRPSTLIACEYGAPWSGAGALSVRTTSFFGIRLSSRRVMVRSRQFLDGRSELDGHVAQIAQLLLRPQDGAAEERVARAGAAAGLDYPGELARAGAFEPSRDPPPHQGAIARDGGPLDEIGRRCLAKPRLTQLANVHPVDIGERPPEEAEGQVSNPPRPRGHRPTHSPNRQWVHQSLPVGKDGVEACAQLPRRPHAFSARSGRRSKRGDRRRRDRAAHRRRDRPREDSTAPGRRAEAPTAPPTVRSR